MDRIELVFPKFTDGRAFSQAVLLRRRYRFAGDLRATGDVLIDQVLQMQRSGFSSAVLAPGIQADAAERLRHATKASTRATCWSRAPCLPGRPHERAPGRSQASSHRSAQHGGNPMSTMTAAELPRQR